MAKKRIAVLTGGGDVPGLNSAIKGIVRAGEEEGFKIIGIRRGWEGLTHLNLEDPESKGRYVKPLTIENTRTIDRTGGTILHTSRTNPAKMKAIPEHLQGLDFPQKETASGPTYDLTKNVMKNLEALKIEKAPPKIIDVTTSSLEAYRAYLLGRDQLERFFAAEARRSLEKAVSLDPEFAVAYLYLSKAFAELGDRKALDESLEKALQFASRASEKERLYIEASYAGSVKRDGAERRRVLELTSEF